MQDGEGTLLSDGSPGLAGFGNAITGPSFPSTCPLESLNYCGNIPGNVGTESPQQRVGFLSGLGNKDKKMLQCWSKIGIYVLCPHFLYTGVHVLHHSQEQYEMHKKTNSSHKASPAISIYSYRIYNKK